jgi:hypothetical protein
LLPSSDSIAFRSLFRIFLDVFVALWRCKVLICRNFNGFSGSNDSDPTALSLASGSAGCLPQTVQTRVYRGEGVGSTPLDGGGLDATASSVVIVSSFVDDVVFDEWSFP